MHDEFMCPISCADVCNEKGNRPSTTPQAHHTQSLKKKSTKNSARSSHKLIKMTENKKRERMVPNSVFQVVGLIRGRSFLFCIFSASFRVGHVA